MVLSNTLFMVLVAVVIVLCIGTAVAQDGNIQLNTDSTSYENGDIMIVYGKVPTVLPNEQMRLQVLYRNTVLLVDQFDVARDGTFTYLVNTQGSQWVNDGQYTIRIWYANDNTSQYFDYAAEGIEDALGMFEVADGRGGTFDVSYSIRGGTIRDMQVDYENLALEISIDAERDGRILLDLPREYIDSIHNDGDDAQYIVLVDGVEMHHLDDMGQEVRRIIVNFDGDTTDIMIIGTQVIPEFGSAFVILIGGVVAISALSRLRMRTFL